MARNLLEPILDGGVTNPHYFEGRLLTATALREDQQAQRAHDRRLGRAVGPGVVEGLWVTLEFAGTATLPPRVRVTAGLAIDANGDALELPAAESVALARTVPPAAQEAGLFHTCPPPDPQVEGPGPGFYVLVLSPASGFLGRAPFSGLSDPRAGKGCGSRWAMEGVRLRLVPLDPLAVSGVSQEVRDLLQNVLLPATTEAGRATLRNVVAHICFGTEPLATFGVDPFARELLPDGGTEPALADYGAIDELIAAKTLTDCDVPLALVHWPSEAVSFVDNWAVRRRLAPPATSATWPTLSGGRRRAEAEAVLLQFQEHMSSLLQQSPNPIAIRARDYFRWLPPAAMVPLPGSGRRGVGEFDFFIGLTTRPVIYIDGARMGELLSISLTQPPIDTTSNEFVWTYRVRQNDLLATDSGPEFPYLVVASGHMPYVGTARFDVARWGRSNFGLL